MNKQHNIYSKFLWVVIFISITPAQLMSQNVVDIQIDWNNPIAEINKFHWGINDEKLSDPGSGLGVQDAGYNELFTQLEPGFIRIHHANLVNNYTDATTRTWNKEKITTAFLAAEAYSNATIMFNLVWWPDWMATPSKPLPSENREEFLQLTKDLVTIFQEIGFEVDYWELLNEREEIYEKADVLNDLWYLIDGMMDAIHEVDPDAKVGDQPSLTQKRNG